MVRSRFHTNQIQKILQKYENGESIQSIIEDYGISQATFYNWRSKYGKISSSKIEQHLKLQEDNERLKLMFAELSLENSELKAQLKILKKHK